MPQPSSLRKNNTVGVTSTCPLPSVQHLHRAYDLHFAMTLNNKQTHELLKCSTCLWVAWLASLCSKNPVAYSLGSNCESWKNSTRSGFATDFSHRFSFLAAAIFAFPSLPSFFPFFQRDRNRDIERGREGDRERAAKQKMQYISSFLSYSAATSHLFCVCFVHTSMLRPAAGKTLHNCFYRHCVIRVRKEERKIYPTPHEQHHSSLQLVDTAGM